jgi:hypothetical protein
MKDPVFDLGHVAELLGCATDALSDIQNFPKAIEGVNSMGEAVVGIHVADFCGWCETLSAETKRRSRSLIGASEAAEVLGVDAATLAQMTTRGMPRFDPTAMAPIYVNDTALFIFEEIVAFRDRHTAMAQLACRTVH